VAGVVRSESFDFISNFSTLWQVFLGAILATGGGFAATQIEWFFERRRRERHAALFFGEVLSTLGVLLQITHRTYGVGDPFGPITTRMLRSAKREIDIYDRNRERLFDLNDAKLRAQVHTLILRLNTPLEGVFDAHDEIGGVEAQMRSPDFPASHREEAQARLDRLKLTRTLSYEALDEASQSIKSVIDQLEPHAHHSFTAMNDAGRAAAAGLGPSVPPI
jgi:hypothetical protein